MQLWAQSSFWGQFDLIPRACPKNLFLVFMVLSSCPLSGYLLPPLQSLTFQKHLSIYISDFLMLECFL